MSWPPSPGPGGERNWRAVTDRGSPSGPRRLVAAVVGTVALAVALAVVFGLGGPGFAETVSTVIWPERLFVYAFANFAAVLVVWTLWRSLTSGDRDDGDVALPAPGAEAGPGEDVVGRDVDEQLSRLADPRDEIKGWQHVDVERAVRSVAVDVLRRDAGYEVDDLSAALEAGTWTDDPRAAAYLGDDVELPIRLRVIDWASGDPYRRRVDAAVAELAAIADVETEVEAP